MLSSSGNLGEADPPTIRIWAESEGEGRGTRITFTLPTVEEAAVVAEGASQPSAPHPQGGERPTPILVVDDDPQC